MTKDLKKENSIIQSNILPSIQETQKLIRMKERNEVRIKIKLYTEIFLILGFMFLGIGLCLKEVLK